jgi:2',3'-cyclic-nucleotide 2'-phosphodiesterase (5'-nucleotidase family)
MRDVLEELRMRTDTPTPPPNGVRPVVSVLTWAAVVVVGTLVTVGLANRWAMLPANPPLPQSANPAPAKAKLFQDWPADQPAVAFVFSGQQHGYIQKCGCSSPQFGGLERRYNFIAQLRTERKWSVVPLDLGDIAYKRGLYDQALLKYELSMKALSNMGYVAVGVGQHEASFPLIDALSRFTLQFPDVQPRVLIANLKERNTHFPLDAKRSLIGTWEMTGGSGGRPKIAVVGLIGPSVEEALKKDPTMRFNDNGTIIPQVLTEIQRQTPDLRVLLYQGTLAEATHAATKLPALLAQRGYQGPMFDVIVCLSAEEEPSALPAKVPQGPGPNAPSTLVLSVGHKGRYVGVLGAFKSTRPGQAFEFKYQLAALGEEYDTPDDRVAQHPILKQLQEYAQQLKDENYLAKYPTVDHALQLKYPNLKVSYIGSEQCIKCHGVEGQIYHGSKHSHAYEALETVARKPTLRQYDGECVSCHVVGFGLNTGFKSEKLTPQLRGVGCESCHGPGSLHAADPNNKDYYSFLSEWKAGKRDAKLPDVATLEAVVAGTKKLTEIEQTLVNRISMNLCQKCHDPDNDPHFRFEKYWPKIAHGFNVKPPAKAAPAGGGPPPGSDY